MNTKEFSASFSFLEHMIEELTVKNTAMSFDDQSIAKRTFDVDYSVLSIDPQNSILVGHLQLDILVHIACIAEDVSENEEEKASKGCKIFLRLIGVFTDNINTDRDTFEKMLCHNGTAALYSIARSIIIDVSAKTAFSGNIRLPMINVYSMVKAKKQRVEHENPSQGVDIIEQDTPE